GPSSPVMTSVIAAQAKALLESDVKGVKRRLFSEAWQSASRRDFVEAYISDLANVIDMDAIRASGLKLGVDPLGGAGVHYWAALAERYGLNLKVVDQGVDPTFQFMSLDWDGRIRMDPSSPYAMRSLIGLKDQFDVAFACDTDHDRHGIVTRGAGLLPANHYLAVCVDYLFANRPQWRADAAVGKTLVSSSMIDRVAASR